MTIPEIENHPTYARLYAAHRRLIDRKGLSQLVEGDVEAGADIKGILDSWYASGELPSLSGDFLAAVDAIGHDRFGKVGQSWVASDE